MAIDGKLIGLVERVVGDVMSRLDTGTSDARPVGNVPAIGATSSAAVDSTSSTELVSPDARAGPRSDQTFAAITSGAGARRNWFFTHSAASSNTR